MGVGRVRLIVHTEFRRRIRAVWRDSNEILAYLFLGAFGLLVVPLLVAGAFSAGRNVADSDPSSLIGVAGLGLAGGFVLAAIFLAVSDLQSGYLPPGSEEVLVAATHRDVLLSLAAVTVAKSIVLVGVPGVLAVVAFAVGAGSPATVVFGSVAVLVVAVLAGLTAQTLALLVRTATARVPVLAKYRVELVAVVFLSYLALLASGHLTDLAGTALAYLVVLPVAPLGHLALLSAVPGANPAVAGVSLLVSGVVLACLVAANMRLSAILWYGTSVDPSGGEQPSSIRPLPVLDVRTSYIVRKTWARARRSPIRLMYVAYPVIIMIGPLSTVVQTGTVPAWTPPALALYAAWATGAAFTLNPIGDETPALPVTLTAPVTGRAFLRALWVAGAAFGVPLGLVSTVGSGVLAGFGPIDLVLLGLLGVALPALAPALAAGFGTVFPETQPTTAVGNYQTVTPSTLAFLGFSVALLVLTAPIHAITPGPVRAWFVARIGLASHAPTAVAVGAAVALVAVAGAASFGVACRRFDGYTLE